MGALLKLVDATLFVFFVVIAVAAPFIDGQTCLPQSFFPEVLVELKSWYARTYGDYLVSQKPHFFVGIVWVELLFQWPLAVANLYGILAAKSWLNTTCLIYGASVFTSMVTFSSFFSFNNIINYSKLVICLVLDLGFCWISYFFIVFNWLIIYFLVNYLPSL